VTIHAAHCFVLGRLTCGWPAEHEDPTTPPEHEHVFATRLVCDVCGKPLSELVFPGVVRVSREVLESQR